MNDHLLNIFSESGCPPHKTLVAYFRNCLPEEEKHLVEKHLVDCEMCSDELEGLSLMKHPEELDRIVRELGRDIEGKRSRVVHWDRRVLILAAAAVIVFLVGSALVIRLLLPGREKPQMMVTLESPALNSIAEKVPPPPPPAMPGSQREQPRKSKEIVKPEKETRIDEKPQVLPDKSNSVSSGAAAVADTQAVIMEHHVLAGVIHPETGDSQAASEIREKPAVSREETVPPAGMKQTVPMGDASKKSQALLFAASPGRADSMGAAMEIFSAGDYRAAKQLFGAIISNQPDNYKALYYSALCSYKLGDPKSAEKALDEILKNPGNDYYRKAEELSKKTEVQRDSILRGRPDSAR